MLSNNGYFKNIKCPYYDCGFCERPYCQFKHLKSGIDNEITKENAVPSDSILQKLVSDAVEKAFSENEGNYPDCSKVLGDKIYQELSSQNKIVSDISIDGLKEKFSLSGQKKFQAKHPFYLPQIPVYKPTPIKELAKRKYSVFSASKQGGASGKSSASLENGQKRFKFYAEEYNPASSNYVSEISKTLYSPSDNIGKNERQNGYFTSSEKEVDQPVYKPTDSQTISEPKYVPSSSDSDNLGSCVYEPSELLSVPTKEPSYVPDTNGMKCESIAYEPSCKDSLPLKESNYDPTSSSSPTLLTYFPDSKVNLKNEEEYKPLGTKDSSVVYIPSKMTSDETEKGTVDNNELCNGKVEFGGKDTSLSESQNNRTLPKSVDPFRDELDDCVEKILSKKIEKTNFEFLNDNTANNKTEASKFSFKVKEVSAARSDSKTKVSPSKKDKPQLSKSNKNDHYSKDSFKSHTSKSKHKHHKSEKKIETKHHKENRHRSSSRSKHNSDKDRHKSRHGASKSKIENKSESKPKHKTLKPIRSLKDKVVKADRQKHDKSNQKHSRSGSNKLPESSKIKKNEPVLRSNGSSLKGLQCFEYESNFCTDLDNEENVEMECMKIFNEYEPDRVDNELSEPPVNDKKSEALLTNSGKKRVAHQAGIGNLINPPPKSIVIRPSAAQVMHERWLSMQHIQDKEINIQPPKMPGKKCRIAAVPYASSLMNAKTQLNTTLAQTNKKGVSRVAHTPTVISSVRPQIPSEFGSKIPPAVRQNYLNILVDECLKQSENEQEAFNKALEEEKDIYNRSSNKKLYCSLAALAISKLRRGLQSVTANKVVSHLSVLAGKSGSKCSWSIEKSRRSSIEQDSMYNSIKQYILTESQLRQNGFPRPDEENKGKAKFYKEFNNKVKKKPSSNNNERICERCIKIYKVDEIGVPIMNEEMCVFHYGRAYKRKGKTGWDSKYSCCQGDLQSEGCVIEKFHVSNQFDPEDQWGYVKTFDDEEETKEPAIYALDCEMCYTTFGNELTRVTVVDTESKSVYETFVKPENTILDYNTRFSGISEDHLKNVKTTLREVQAVLLSMFSSRTVLIGHSLESDFTALKLIHDTVVDTSLVFPHRLGSEYKRALRTLCADYLKRIVQNDVGGHDSAEDAVACMDLMKWKIKDDAKTKTKK